MVIFRWGSRENVVAWGYEPVTGIYVQEKLSSKDLLGQVFPGYEEVF
ncbi:MULTISPECIES: hypothetical protein [Paenibacillus]|nr:MULTISPECIES: hypothetical protein [Paenibacillus]